MENYLPKTMDFYLPKSMDFSLPFTSYLLTLFVVTECAFFVADLSHLISTMQKKEKSLI